MDFLEAAERLKACITDDDIAQAAGVAANTIRRSRADPSTRNYRPPPTNWRQVIARLARSRARELDALAAEVENGSEKQD
jgi:hypothetical protein